jgi:hypothetical protein
MKIKNQSFLPGSYSSFLGTIGLVFLSGMGISSSANAASIISDSIAEHFDQVFFSQDQDERETGLLPGDEQSDNVLGTDWNLEIDGTWIFPSGIDGKEGNKQVSHVQSSLSITMPFKSADSISLLVRSSNYFLDETLEGDPGPLFDFDRINEEHFGVLYTKNLTPDWDLMVGVGGLHSDGDGPQHEESFGSILFLGAVNRLTPSLRIGWGTTFSNGYSYSKGAFPIFFLDWIINERNQLTVKDGLMYSYALTDDWKRVLSFSIDFESLTVKLDEYEDEGEPLSDPYLTVVDIGLNLGYYQKFDSGLTFFTKLGVLHGGTHIVSQRDDNVVEYEFDFSVGCSFGLNYRF